MDKKVNIRKANKKDYEAVNNLLTKLHMYHVENCPEHFLPIDIFFTEKEYNKRLEIGYAYYLANVNNQIVGIIGVNISNNGEINICHVNSLYVEKEFRNKNIATLLMKKAFEYFKENCNTSKFCDHLNLTVSAFNRTAIEFYKKIGFEFASYKMSIKLK